MKLNNRYAYFFILPAFLYLSVWLFFPILNNFYLSLLDAETARSRDYFFVGLDNYKELFQDQDDSFNKNWEDFLEYIGIDGNWEKTPAEYILKIISEMYNIEINIYSTLSCNKQEIVGWNYDYFNLRKIY